MKKVIVFALAAFLMAAASVSAGDVKKKFTLESAKSSSAVQEVLNSGIAFYWGGQKYPKAAKEIGVYKTSKRTNGFMKAEEEACAHALASAMIAFQERALKEGGTLLSSLFQIYKITPSQARQNIAA